MAAQPSASSASPQITGDGTNLTVYLLTIGQGDAIWERFGHNAIWIHDEARSLDIAYNWGLFDFNDADFYSRFARGDMRYWMGALGLTETIAFYRGANRSIYAQELDLTPAQKRDLQAFVEWNALPQNRYYSYDYFRDNCSTRVRDAIDRVLGGAIQRVSDRTITQTTYRSHTRRLIQRDHLFYTGIHFGLGQPADRRISVWEEMFLPMRMRESLRSVRVSRPGGIEVPLVKREIEVFRSTRPDEPASPPNDLPVYFAIGVAVAAILAALGGVAARRPSPRAFAIAAGTWTLVIGIAGTGLAALWLFTQHVYSYHNENLLQSNPLTLVLAFALFASAGTTSVANKAQTGTRTRTLAFVVAGLSVLGFLIQVLPSFYQVNGEIIALMLPANVVIALVLFRRWGQKLLPDAGERGEPN
ncbi:MAG TPA: DUF4105 domain-containing protein [Gemmatimonadaceae bacterium]